MPSNWMVVPAAVGISLIAGYLLYSYRGSTVSVLDGLWRSLMALVWMAAAFITITQDFIVTGMIFLGLFFSFFLKNSEHAKENYDGQASKTRRRLGNWDPWWVRE